MNTLSNVNCSKYTLHSRNEEFYMVRIVFKDGKNTDTYDMNLKNGMTKLSLASELRRFAEFIEGSHK